MCIAAQLRAKELDTRCGDAALNTICRTARQMVEAAAKLDSVLLTHRQVVHSDAA